MQLGLGQLLVCPLFCFSRSRSPSQKRLQSAVCSVFSSVGFSRYILPVVAAVFVVAVIMLLSPLFLPPFFLYTPLRPRARRIVDANHDERQLERGGTAKVAVHLLVSWIIILCRNLVWFQRFWQLEMATVSWDP